MIYKTKEELLARAKQAEGKTFGEIDKTGRIENEKAKGHLGQIIEESFFGYELNSDKKPDFSNLGVELKVTPIKRNKKGTISAKERLVLNIINYHEEAEKDFETSSFWKKNKEILMMFYEWKPKIPRSKYKIIKSYLHKYPPEDLEIIKQDWKIINDKIRAGLAHEISEADTTYLAASTKGASKKSLRTQPYSDKPAMQRAYSLKQSYMTTIVRQVINKESLKKISTANELRKKSLYDILEEKFRPYIGMTLKEISHATGIEITKSTNFLQNFISGLLGIKGTKLNQIEEFAKSNIQFKTVRLEPNGYPKEHMSFQNVDFHKWVEESWEESWMKNYFEETKFMFVVFHYKESKTQNPGRELYFKGITFWNMPQYEIDGRLKEFWEHVKTLLIEGVELTEVIQKSGKIIVKNNLPKSDFNGLCHLRPKGRDASDKIKLPDGQWITKQCFWLNREYIGDICKKIKN